MPGLACAVLATLGQPLAAVAFLVLACAAALPGVSGGLLANVPAAAVLVMGAILAVGEAASVARLAAYHHAAVCRGLLVAAAALVVVVAALRGRPSRAGWRPDVAALCAAVPAAALVAVAVVLAVRPAADQVQWFLEGDNPRHLIFAAQTWGDGGLDYGADPYPRGWHALTALLWGASGASWQASGLVSLLELMTSATWGLAGLLTLATGLLARALALRLGVVGIWRGLLPLLAGSVLLTPPFLANYLALGFQNSLVAALVLATVSLEILHAGGRARSLAVMAAGVAVVANAWQLLLPAALLALIWAAVLHLRGSGAGRTRSAWVTVALAAAVAGVVSLPGVAAVVVQTGLDHGVNAGVDAPLPVGWLAAGLASTLALVLLSGRRVEVLAVPGILVTTVATGLALAVVLRISPALYYPSKTLWHASALGLPVVFAVLGWGLSRARWASRPGPPLAVLAGVSIAATLLCLTSPSAAVRGSWSSVEGAPVIAMVTSRGVEGAQVIWTDDPEDDTLARILLDFYRVDDTLQRTVQHPSTVEEDCRLLRSAPIPTVASDRPHESVRARYACVPSVRVIAIDRS